MKKVMAVMLGLVAAMTVQAGTFAEDYSAYVSADYVSKYMWRGYDLLDGDGAIQPDIGFSHDPSGIYLGVWTSFATERDWEDYDELDPYIGIGQSIGSEKPYQLDLDLSYTAVLYPNAEVKDDVQYQTIALNASLPNLASTEALSIVPSAGVFCDIALADTEEDLNNWWYMLGLSATPSAIPVELYVETYINGGAYDLDAGFGNISTGLRASHELAGFELKGSANYNYTIEEEINADENEFWFTAGVSYTMF